MNSESISVPLGFTEEMVAVGTHMCLVFTSEKERVNSLLKFLLSGLKNNERCACFTERLTENDLRQFLEKNDIEYEEVKDQNAISLSGTTKVYFPNNCFDPERMLKLLSDYYSEAKEMGFKASRVIGEMEPLVETIKGGERLLEYESRVSILVKEKPITAICQYDANKFSGGIIMEVLKVHPKMIVNGAVIKNPFFIEPEEYLANSLHI